MLGGDWADSELLAMVRSTRKEKTGKVCLMRLFEKNTLLPQLVPDSPRFRITH